MACLQLVRVTIMSDTGFHRMHIRSHGQSWGEQGAVYLLAHVHILVHKCYDPRAKSGGFIYVVSVRDYIIVVFWFIILRGVNVVNSWYHLKNSEARLSISFVWDGCQQLRSFGRVWFAALGAVIEHSKLSFLFLVLSQG